VEVGVADARVLDVDKDFIWAGLLDGDALIGGGWGTKLAKGLILERVMETYVRRLSRRLVPIVRSED
jgi:hypothetical protein